MAETFSGIVEIQESSGGVTRIVINGDASTVTVGSAGQAGTLVLQNAQGQNTMLLDTVVRPVIEQPAGAGDPAAAAGHAPMVVGDVYCSVTSVTLTTPF